MNNFFYNSSDYSLFKKALKTTNNESVVINILSTDSSLMAEETIKPIYTERKSMSDKYQASPFGKFFGPRKKRTEPLDMKDFSSWKNKNYRESEKQINEEPEQTTKFSFSDFLKSHSNSSQYNEEDTVKAELQKPIDQISSGDEDYKKYSLDSYLTKLEQQEKVSGEFSQTEDLIDNLDEMQFSAPSSDQDETFGSSSDVDVEHLASENLGGEKFAFEQEELEKVKNRLDKMEREANNIKEKSTEKVISTNELSELTKSDEDEEFSLDKLGFEDDIDKVNKNLSTNEEEVNDENKPKVQHKRFIEINKNEGFVPKNKKESDEDLENDEKSEDLVDELESKDEDSENKDKKEKSSEDKTAKDEVEGEDKTDSDKDKTEDKESTEKGEDKSSETTDEIPIDENKVDGESTETTENKENNTINTVGIVPGSDVLTKTDLKNMTDEIINKFSALYKPTSVAGSNDIVVQPNADIGGFTQPNVSGMIVAPQGYTSQDQNQLLQQQQTELQTKIVELIEQNKMNDNSIAEKLRLAELEKQQVAQQYENRLKELESSLKQRDEEAKQQAYIEKLKSDIKLKKAETNYKKREEKIKSTQKAHSEKMLAKDKLKSELKNKVNLSNLEMDKKLLECVTKSNKMNKKLTDSDNLIAETDVEEVQTNDEVEVEKKTRTRRTARNASRNTTRAASRKKSTVKSRTRSRAPRRKIDSDIIGGIDFD